LPNSTATVLVSSLSKLLTAHFGAVPYIGAEVECYVALPEGDIAAIDAFWLPVKQALLAQNIPLLRIEQEQGKGQFELVIGVTSPEAMCGFITQTKYIVEAQAKAQGVTASFEAKPYPNQPSSGLHIHVHLANHANENLFHKTEEDMSEMLAFSLGGLLATLPHFLPIWCPNDSTFTRFLDSDHVPRTLSWGVNNRYCALRIPMIQDPYSKRIEHRMSHAHADAQAVIAAILAGVYIGLEFRITPPEQEYGKPEAVPVAQWQSTASPEAIARLGELFA
jgi:glutamine synthetase